MQFIITIFYKCPTTFFTFSYIFMCVWMTFKIVSSFKLSIALLTNIFYLTRLMFIKLVPCQINFFKVSFLPNFLLQCSQIYFFSLTCTSYSCRFKCSFLLNCPLHCSQLYSLMQSCTSCTCRFRYPFLLNFAPHISQL